jgi:ABC-type molybdenum transport system ATPase subunit/photorepair protein PhrA
MIKGYNIVYLDEIDATLSTENRRLFIDLLKKQMKDLNIEQLFIITHNNAFYNQNVDLILFKGHDCPSKKDKYFYEGKNVLLEIK